MFFKNNDLLERFHSLDENKRMYFYLNRSDPKYIINNFELINPIINGVINGAHSDVYNIDDNYIFKFDKRFINNKFKVDYNTVFFNPEILDFLSREKYSLLKYSKLPKGEIIYKNTTVGLIYEYFKDYNNLENLVNEDKDFVYFIIEKTIRNIMELIDFDIYHEDLKLQNILYKDSDVQIIDFDSYPYMRFYKNKDIYCNCYSVFICTLIQMLKKRSNDIELLKELDVLFNKYSFMNDYDTLYKFNDELISKKLVK